MDLSLLLNFSGLVLNGIGVLLLGREVLLAQKSEKGLITIKMAEDHALAVLKDPMGQAKKDHDEMMANLDSLNLNDQLVAKIADAVWRMLPDPHLEQQMKLEALALGQDATKAIAEQKKYFEEKVTPKALAMRGKLLKIGVLSIIIGIILQMAGILWS